MSPDPNHSAVYTYRVYGLTVRLPFPCAALPVAEPGCEPDVIVAEGTVPRELRDRSNGDLAWDAAPGRFLLRGGRRSGRFLVADGRVVLARSRDADDVVLARHFTDRVLAAVLRQRGLLVLHASAAQTPAGVVAISGESGAGKSTTLAALLDQGCTMLSDDITALQLSAHGCVEVLPGCAQMHLTEDAARGLGLDISNISLQPWRRMKAAVPTLPRMVQGAAPLHAIARLTTHAADDVEVVALAGVAKFNAIQESIYGPVFPEEHPGLFPLSGTTASIDVFEIRRPEHRWSATEAASALLTATDRLSR